MEQPTQYSNWICESDETQQYKRGVAVGRLPTTEEEFISLVSMDFKIFVDLRNAPKKSYSDQLLAQWKLQGKEGEPQVIDFEIRQSITPFQSITDFVGKLLQEMSKDRKVNIYIHGSKDNGRPHILTGLLIASINNNFLYDEVIKIIREKFATRKTPMSDKIFEEAKQYLYLKELLIYMYKNIVKENNKRQLEFKRIRRKMEKEDIMRQNMLPHELSEQKVGNIENQKWADEMLGKLKRGEVIAHDKDGNPVNVNMSDDEMKKIFINERRKMYNDIVEDIEKDLPDEEKGSPLLSEIVNKVMTANDPPEDIVEN